MARSEVADGDACDFALLQCVLRTKPVLGSTIRSRAGFVDEVEVDMVDLEKLRGLVDSI